MATIAEQLTSLAETKTAIKDAIVNRGVAVSDTDTFRSYADKIGQIQAGGGEPATKFGATVDTFLGDVDANGVYQEPTGTKELNLSGVKSIGSYGMQYRFYKSKCISSVISDSLQSIDAYGFDYAFQGNSNLTRVELGFLETVSTYGMRNSFNGCPITHLNLSSLKNVGEKAFDYAFYGCKYNVELDLSSLETIGFNGFNSAFYGNSNLENVNLSSLKTLDNRAFDYAFNNCGKLTILSFPSLTNVQSASFGLSSTLAFKNCNSLTEIHFRADMQATIEGLTGYSSKFGATNATIYFDL